MSADQLLAAYQYAADLRLEDSTREPQSCPHDGTPYSTGPDNELYCPWDGYRPGYGTASP